MSTNTKTTSPEKKPFSFAVLKSISRNSVRIFKIIWPDKKGTIIGLICIVAFLSAVPFLRSGSSALVINELARNIGSQSVSSDLIAFLGLFTLALIIPSVVYGLMNTMGKLLWFYMEEKFTTILMHKRAEIDVAVYENPKKSDLLNRVAETGIYRIQNFVDRQFYILQNIVEVLIAAGVIAVFKWWVLAAILVCTIPELITETKYGKDVWNIHMGKAEIRRKYRDYASHFEYLKDIIEIKLFQNLKHFTGTILGLFKTFQNEQIATERKQLRANTYSVILSQSGIAFAGIWFVLEVVRGNMEIGSLVFVLASITELRNSLSSFFANIGRQYQDNLFVTDVFEMLDIQPAIPHALAPVRLAKTKTPRIEFKNVSFAYPQTDKLVLKNVSFAIEPGEKIALVGINGTGKTTLVKLLCRFYDPTAGKILVDGTDLRDISLEDWHGTLGALFQDYSRYHFTVKEAIAVGNTGKKIMLEKVKQAARASEADVFIEEWEKRYNQMLGKSFSEGIEPSIGQWQKLALARTFYRDPQIIILDEPTSSIDAEAEEKIFNKLENLPEDRTVILISHRFSTVRHANKIIVLERGRVSEIGSHAELLAQNKTYARLFRLQAKGYE